MKEFLKEIHLHISVTGMIGMLFDLIAEISTEDKDESKAVLEIGATVVKLFAFCVIISLDKLNVEGGEVITIRV
jgi:hypothetical protein